VFFQFGELAFKCCQITTHDGNCFFNLFSPVVALSINTSSTTNVGFESSPIDGQHNDQDDARVEQIEEAIAIMRRDLTALKGQLTKLKKHVGLNGNGTN
jgi:hypothetical protein